MKPSEYVLIIALAVVNLAAGFGCAVPIAKGLAEINDRPGKFFSYFAMLIGIYFVECVAFSAGMATQVFTIGLAFIWGIVLGLWFRGQASPHQILGASFFLSIYTSLPTASFGILILSAWLVEGNSILSVEGGTKLGIPSFVPWPLNTILGFCSALTIGTVILKTVITTGEVSLLIHLGEKKEQTRETECR